MSVLYLYSCKNVPETDKCVEQLSVHIPHLPHAAPFPSSQQKMWEGNVFWKTSVTATLAFSITLFWFCPEPLLSLSACPALRLQRKMLPELGIGADHLSKPGLKWSSNGQRIKPQSRLSFRLSSATLPSPCLFLFHRASLLIDKRN